MSQAETVTIPARRGKAVRLKAGQRLKIVNTHGTQVVDCWAFNAKDMGEYMSMPHSRNAVFRLAPAPGDVLVTNRRRPILAFDEDSSPGVHDTLVPCCDATRYAQLGRPGHDNCADNMAAGLRELGIEPPAAPLPFNLFMNVPIGPGGKLELAAPVSRPGDYVVLRAEIDCVVAMSACPHDIFPVNGADCTPRDAAFAILD